MSEVFVSVNVAMMYTCTVCIIKSEDMILAQTTTASTTTTTITWRNCILILAIFSCNYGPPSNFTKAEGIPEKN
jgi:hypothetical protein